MSALHQIVLSGALALLGLSLVGPGIMSVLRPSTGTRWLVAGDIDARNHLRALNAMMTAVGALALWACLDLAEARAVVIALGVIMALLVVARLYSILVDGRPGPMTLVYLLVEAGLAGLFLLWPPPAA